MSSIKKPSASSLDAAIRDIDDLLASVGLIHGTRSTRPRRESQAATAKRKASLHPPKSKAKPAPNVPVVLRVPAWERYPWLIHGTSTRPGGVSTVYAPQPRRKAKPNSDQGLEQRVGQVISQGELNLGLTSSDAPANVRRNREIFLRALLDIKATSKSASLPALALLRQIHSGIVYRLGNVTEHDGAALAGDGMMTAQSGLLLGILTADCLPVLVVDVRQRVVAAFHAGWRGTAARIVERGIGRMQMEFGSKVGDLTAAIGPGIGACCYAIGDEVRSEFDSQFAYSDQLFREVYDSDPIKEKYPLLFMTARAPGHSNLGPSTHLDLAEANRRQLLDAGVGKVKIHAFGLCTACHAAQFFSHRGEQGFTGRMMTVVGIR